MNQGPSSDVVIQTLIILSSVLGSPYLNLLILRRSKRHAYAESGDNVFTPAERELIFDIDISDYDDATYCCSGVDVCLNCWPLMVVAVKVMTLLFELTVSMDTFGTAATDANTNPNMSIEHFLSSSMDKTVRLWNLSTESCLKIFSHSDYVTCIRFKSVDEQYFITASVDAKVRIWSIPGCKLVDRNDLHEMVMAVCYAPDGQDALV